MHEVEEVHKHFQSKKKALYVLCEDEDGYHFLMIKEFFLIIIYYNFFVLMLSLDYTSTNVIGSS